MMLGSPHSIASRGNWMSIPNPTKHCAPAKKNADLGDMAPRAMGRNLVRETCESNSRSQKSLMVQPAERMMKAPEAKRAVVPITETGDRIGEARVEARRVDQRHG